MTKGVGCISILILIICRKGYPPHARDSRIIKKAVDELIKNRWLLSKPTHYGLELSLNIEKKKEIEEYAEKDLF